MRAILFDWIIEVADEFLLKRDTLHAAMSYIDQYLSKCNQEVVRADLQLLGISSLLLACKVEEVLVPSVKDFVLATDNSYSKEAIVEVEGLVAKTLGWSLLPSTIFTWVQYYVQQWEGFIGQ